MTPDDAVHGGVAVDAAASGSAIATYALRLGDDALVLSHRLSEWSSLAPELEEDIALTNIALDLLGQARVLLGRAGELEGSGRDEDAFAYRRHDGEFVNCQLVELPIGDFAATMARQLLFSAYQCELYRALADSTDPVLAGLATKATKEVVYHREHAGVWVRRLGDGTEQSHRRMQEGLDRTWPYAAELYETDDLLASLVRSGVAADVAALQPAADAFVATVLEEATLAVPATSWRPTGGRRGRHTEHLGYLLAEMQHLHRSYPGVRW